MVKVYVPFSRASCGDFRPWSLRASCDVEANPKNSERLEKAGTVDFKEHPAQKVGSRFREGSRQVYLSRCPKSQNLKHLAIREDVSSNFPAIFPEFSSGTPEPIPEIATAFSSFLKNR